jgi:hypothetical protein
LPPATAELKQAENLGGLVPVRIGDHGNAGGVAARVGVDSDGLNLAPTRFFRRIVNG